MFTPKAAEEDAVVRAIRKVGIIFFSSTRGCTFLPAHTSTRYTARRIASPISIAGISLYAGRNTEKSLFSIIFKILPNTNNGTKELTASMISCTI